MSLVGLALFLQRAHTQLTFKVVDTLSVHRSFQHCLRGSHGGATTCLQLPALDLHLPELFGMALCICVH